MCLYSLLTAKIPFYFKTNHFKYNYTLVMQQLTMY